MSVSRLYATEFQSEPYHSDLQQHSANAILISVAKSSPNSFNKRAWERGAKEIVLFLKEITFYFHEEHVTFVIVK